MTSEQWDALCQDVTFSKAVLYFAIECGPMGFNSWQKSISQIRQSLASDPAAAAPPAQSYSAWSSTLWKETMGNTHGPDWKSGMPAPSGLSGLGAPDVPTSSAAAGLLERSRRATEQIRGCRREPSLEVIEYSPRRPEEEEAPSRWPVVWRQCLWSGACWLSATEMLQRSGRLQKHSGGNRICFRSRHNCPCRLCASRRRRSNSSSLPV